MNYLIFPWTIINIKLVYAVLRVGCTNDTKLNHNAFRKKVCITSQYQCKFSGELCMIDSLFKLRFWKAMKNGKTLTLFHSIQEKILLQE